MTILWIIIIVDVIALGFVMWIGSRHDPYSDISAVDQSSAVVRLRERYGRTKAGEAAVGAAVKTLEKTGNEELAEAVGDLAAVKETAKEAAKEASEAESEDSAPTSAG